MGGVSDSKGTSIVTGAGARAGIGRGVALKLAEEGARVGVLDVNFATAQETAGLITSAGGQAMAVGVNVADESAGCASGAAG